MINTITYINLYANICIMIYIKKNIIGVGIMEKAIKIRYNKHYTSVLINHVTKESFLQACQAAKQQPGPTVVKPTRAAFFQYKEDYQEERLMRETREGESFSIMGVPFKVMKQDPQSSVNGNVELVSKGFLIDDQGVKEVPQDFLLFYQQSLIENVYNAVTQGGLLYY